MNQPESRNAVVLVIDGLNAGMLGPYGNTCIETENFNRLAARSLTFDYAFTPSTQIEKACQALWQCEPQTANQKNLLDTIGQFGISSTLVSEEKSLEAIADGFDRIVPVQSEGSKGLADSIEETELARFFAQALESLGQISEESGSLYWLHAKGLLGAWDAPYELRSQLAHPEDPEPPRFHEPPIGRFDLKSGEEDELLGYQQACGAQVFLLDQFLGVILDLLETEAWGSTMFCITSTIGYPLGEHGLIGKQDADVPNFYNESLHVPLMVSLPGGFEPDANSVRNRSLLSTEELPRMIADWFDNDKNKFLQRWSELKNTLPDVASEAFVIIEGDYKAIQTHAWKLVVGPDKVELFAKPDDRWEVNEVGRRCPQVIEALSEILSNVDKDGGLGGFGDFKLPELLSSR